MTRRDASWLAGKAAASAGAAAFFGPWLRAAQNHRHDSAPADPHDWTGYRPKFFSPEEFGWLRDYCAILIPTDETPGAREAHVADFIDFVVSAAAEFAPETQRHWREAMEWLRTNGFGKLSAQERLDLVAAASAPERDRSLKYPAFASFRLIKEMTVRAFYTSRAGLVETLHYSGIGYLSEFPACEHPEHRQV